MPAEVECTIEECDIFDFMAIHAGFTVLHPGGLRATRTLAQESEIGPTTTVVDIACEKGTSAIFLAKHFGCRVVGIDISQTLITEGQGFVRRSGLGHLVELRQGDALDLPFSDGEFDVAVSQAMLVLVSDKKRAIREALRVTKEGGRVAWNELSWRRNPTPKFLQEVSRVICARCMLNVDTYEGWQRLLADGGVGNLRTLSFPMQFNAIGGMIPDEGMINTARIMWRYVANSRIRKRMKTMDRFFRQNASIFGYGIYVGQG